MPGNDPKKTFLCLSLETGVYILATVLLMINIAIISFRSYFIGIGDGLKDWTEPLNDSVGTHRLIFSFYVWEDNLEAQKKEILMWGGLEIAINSLSAILAILGIVGTLKKTPLLVRLFSVGVGGYLGYWAARIIFTAMTAHDFTLSSGVAWTMSILLSLALLVLLAILGYFLAYSFYLKLQKEKEEGTKVRQLHITYFLQKVKN